MILSSEDVCCTCDVPLISTPVTGLVMVFKYYTRCTATYQYSRVIAVNFRNFQSENLISISFDFVFRSAVLYMNNVWFCYIFVFSPHISAAISQYIHCSPWQDSHTFPLSLVRCVPFAWPLYLIRGHNVEHSTVVVQSVCNCNPI